MFHCNPKLPYKISFMSYFTTIYPVPGTGNTQMKGVWYQALRCSQSLQGDRLQADSCDIKRSGREGSVLPDYE